MGKPLLHCHRRFKNGKDHCYWSSSEKRRTRRGWVQRPILYLGEINDRQRQSWTKVIAVFDPVRQQTEQLALYPDSRPIPDHAWGGCNWTSSGRSGCRPRAEAQSDGACCRGWWRIG